MSVLAYKRTAPDEFNTSDGDELYLGLRLSSWIKVLTLTVLFSLLFWPNLQRLWGKTNPINGEDNWKHGVFVPIIGLYYLYVNREHMMTASARATWSGMVITFGGILFYAYAIWPGQNDWFKDVGMVVTLFGLVTLMCGWAVMRTAWFPIVFLVCALPWPGLFYSLIAGPLQKMAAWVAVKCLNMLGVASAQFGTKIFVTGKDHIIRTLNVEEACSGLRSLMTFIAIAGAVAFLSFRPLWQKLLMVASAVPIAIFCNTMRITVQGLLDGYGNHQFAEGFAHSFFGLAMMIPAFFLILLVGWVLGNIFIDEVDDKSLLRANSQVQRKSGTPVRVAAIPRAASLSAGGVSTPRPAVREVPVAQAQAQSPNAALQPLNGTPVAGTAGPTKPNPTQTARATTAASAAISPTSGSVASAQVPKVTAQPTKKADTNGAPRVGGNGAPKAATRLATPTSGAASTTSTNGSPRPAPATAKAPAGTADRGAAPSTAGRTESAGPARAAVAKSAPRLATGSIQKAAPAAKVPASGSHDRTLSPQAIATPQSQDIEET